MKNFVWKHGRQCVLRLLMLCFVAVLAAGFELQDIRAEPDEKNIYLEGAGISTFDIRGRELETISLNVPSVTITDSVGTGTVETIYVGGGDSVMPVSLTLQAGDANRVTVRTKGSKVIINGGTVGTISGAPENYSVTMNGGLITGGTDTHYIEDSAVSCHAFTMNGGTIKVPNARAVQVTNGSDIAIHGGTIDARIAIGVMVNNPADDGYYTDVTKKEPGEDDKLTRLIVTGGTIRGANWNDPYTAAYMMQGAALELGGLTEVSITGGKIEGPVKITNCDKVFLDKADFLNPVWLGADYDTPTNENVLISGGTFQNGVEIKDGSTVTIKGGRFHERKLKTVSDYVVDGLYFGDSHANVTIEDGIFDGIVVGKDSEAEIKGGTIYDRLWCWVADGAEKAPLRLSGGTFQKTNQDELITVSFNEHPKVDTLSLLAEGYCYKEVSGGGNRLSIDSNEVKGTTIKIVQGKPSVPETSYKISFDSNGGTKVSTVKNLEDGEKYGTLPKTTRKGYKFLGWYTKKTSGTKVSASTKLKEPKNITLYAHWKRATYKLTYKLQGGKLSGSYKKSYNITTKTFQLPKPKRSGYTFRGWSTSAKKFKPVTKIKKGTTGDKTFYAWWTKKASSAPKLSESSVRMSVGQSVTLKVTGTKKKVTWKSSNKKVATVKNGKVTAKKAGTVKITATVAGKKLTCTINVQPKKKATVYKAPAEGTWYKVGKDIPAGEYVIKATSSHNGLVSVCRPGSEEAPIYEEMVSENVIITLSKGMMVSYEDCTAIPIAESLDQFSIRKEGMFKVGFHIPAGVYTLKNTRGEGYDAFYYIYKSSRPETEYKLESFTEKTVQVKVKKGEYLRLSLCKLAQ